MDSNQGKKCNICGEELLCDTRRCPYCGSLLENINSDFRNNNVEISKSQDSIQENTISLEKNDEVNAENIIEKGNENADKATNENTNVDEGEINNDINLSKSDEQNAFNADKYILNDLKYKSLGNGMKVFIVAISSFIPGLGQLIGIITAIVFMNNENDKDRKSFGVALLISSLIIFVLSFCLYCVLAMAITGKGK